MEAGDTFEVVDAVTWGRLHLDPGEIVSLQDLFGCEQILLDLGALTPSKKPVTPRDSFGLLV